MDPRLYNSGTVTLDNKAGKRKKMRKHSKNQGMKAAQVEHIEVGVTDDLVNRMNSSGHFGSGANPSTKRYESEIGNSREERTNRYSSKVSRDDGPKSSILIDVNESVEFKEKLKPNNLDLTSERQKITEAGANLEHTNPGDVEGFQQDSMISPRCDSKNVNTVVSSHDFKPKGEQKAASQEIEQTAQIHFADGGNQQLDVRVPSATGSQQHDEEKQLPLAS